MKTPDQIVTDIQRRLAGSWHTHLDASGDLAMARWPHQFPLGTPSQAALEKDFDRYLAASLRWRDWCATNNVELLDQPRRVHGTTQRIPSHIVVPDLDAAARISGPAWGKRIARGRQRLAVLRAAAFAGDLNKVVRDVDGYGDADFALLCGAAAWFRENGDLARGLTPRQVPVPGLHAKWLNAHQSVVAALAGLDSLRLLPRHPPRIHFTYLDPGHRTAGRRWHDSATAGDPMSPAYRPSVVLISENKDTALHFPPLAGGIAIEGAGSGPTAATIDWVRECPALFYWGDLDVAGLEILDSYRHAGLPVRSILMDIATYDLYAEHGTSMDARGNPLTCAPRRELEHLTEGEQRLYKRLTDPMWGGHRRVEQERIPLAAAFRAISEALGEMRAANA